MKFYILSPFVMMQEKKLFYSLKKLIYLSVVIMFIELIFFLKSMTTKCFIMSGENNVIAATQLGATFTNSATPQRSTISAVQAGR